MRIALLTALATASLLGACGRSETAEKSVATNSTDSAENNGATAAQRTGPVTKEEALALFHERHEGMEQIGKSVKTIKQGLDDGAPDRDPIQSAAATIAHLAGKSSNWFPEGTGKDVLPKTRALPAIWEKPRDFAAKDAAFQKAAQAMQTAANGNDVKAMRSSFAALGKTCKACHDSYRAEKHPK